MKTMKSLLLLLFALLFLSSSNAQNIGRTWCIEMKGSATSDGKIDVKWKAKHSSGAPIEFDMDINVKKGETAMTKACNFYNTLKTVHNKTVSAAKFGTTVCMQLKATNTNGLTDITSGEITEITTGQRGIRIYDPPSTMTTGVFRLEGESSTEDGQVLLQVGFAGPEVIVGTFGKSTAQIMEELTDAFNAMYDGIYIAENNDDGIKIPEVPCDSSITGGTTDTTRTITVGLTDLAPATVDYEDIDNSPIGDSELCVDAEPGILTLQMPPSNENGVYVHLDQVQSFTMDWLELPFEAGTSIVLNARGKYTSDDQGLVSLYLKNDGEANHIYAKSSSGKEVSKNIALYKGGQLVEMIENVKDPVIGHVSKNPTGSGASMTEDGWQAYHLTFSAPTPIYVSDYGFFNADEIRVISKPLVEMAYLNSFWVNFNGISEVFITNEETSIKPEPELGQAPGSQKIQTDINDVTIYPNPVQKELNYHFDGKERIGMIRVLASNGEEKMQINSTDRIGQVDISDLAPGVYFLSITTRNEQVINTRFVKL